MRRGLIIGLILILLLGAVWYFLIAKPIQDRKADAEIQLQAAQDQEAILRTELARLRKIQENQLEYQSAIGELEAAIPSTPQLDQLIDELQLLAKDSGVVWLSGSYSLPAQVPGSDFFAVALSLQVEGQFFEVLGYLYGIAEMDRLVRIDNVTLNPAQDENGFTTVSGSIGAFAFTTAEVTVPEIDLESLLPPATDAETTTEESVAEEPVDDTGGTSDESETTTTTIGGG